MILGMMMLHDLTGKNLRRPRLAIFFNIILAVSALSGCQPYPLHIDPLSVNGRDGGGAAPSYAALMRIGEAARAGGDYSNAVAVFRRAAEIEPRLPDPFIAIGDALLSLGAVNEAIIAYNSALARDSTSLAGVTGPCQGMYRDRPP